MKKLRYSIFSIMFLVFSASGACADVNEVLAFTNFTDEELYVQLSVFDNSGRYIYDLYVLPDRTSIADFWADTIYATYFACAYGEITGDFYGCIEGGITDYNNNIYFDYTGEPYLSSPSDLPVEVFLFENPYNRPDVVVIEADSHYHARGGCFIGSMSFR